jgi:hypothetical protein
MANRNIRAFPKGIREIRYPSEDIIQRFTAKDYTGTIRLNNSTGLFEFDPPLEDIGGSSAGTTFTVSQPAHGFNVMQPIYHDGTEFKLANASSANTLGIWVVIEVTSDNAFVAAQSGRFEIENHNLSLGNFYFVNDIDGGLTPTEPVNYSNPIIYVETEDIIHVLPYRPSSSTEGGGGNGGGAVDSVFGRVGIVTAQSGDYTKDQIGLGNVDNTQQIPISYKGSANGVAELDSGGKVPLNQLPNAVQGGINIIGFWDANTNTPDISSLILQEGQAYQVSVAGNTNLNGITVWGLYDLAIWDNSISGNWFKITSSGQVTSVNSQTGAVVLSTDEITEGSNLYYTEDRVNNNINVASNTIKVSADGSINTHSDIDTITIPPVNGQYLGWDGFNWVPQNSLGNGDMLKAVYDPTNINASVFDYNNFINTPTILSTFLELTDTPSDFTGQGGKALLVNVGETGLVFGESSNGGLASVAESDIIAIRAITGYSDGNDVLNYSTGILYEFDETEITVDDGINYLTPGDIIEPNPGRWVLKNRDRFKDNTPISWNGTESPNGTIDMSKHNFEEHLQITNTTTSITLAVENLSVGNSRVITIDNSINTSAISTITFATTGGVTWKWGKFVEPTGGMAIGEIAELTIEVRSATSIRAYWESLS